jgi:RNA-binding protein Musashi
LLDYFGTFGEVKICRIIYKHDSKVSRGFGFIVYQDKESADKVIDMKDNHYIKGKWVDCKSAILRQEMKPPTVAAS